MSGVEFPCCVEYAKSDRSRCVKCKSTILKQELRIGQQYDPDHSSYRWYHLECFQHAKGFPKTSKTAEEFLFGFEKISSIDQKRVSRTIEKAVYHRDHGGAHASNSSEDDDDSDDDEEERPKKKKEKTTKKKLAHHVKVHEKKEEKEKEVEKEPEPQSWYGTTTSTSFNNYGFGGFENKENENHNIYSLPSSTSGFNSSSQVFASSPLKTASSSSSHSTGDLSSFLQGLVHRLSRQQIDWLLRPSQNSDKVRRAVEAARALYGLDNDEDDLVDTLERIYVVLGESAHYTLSA